MNKKFLKVVSLVSCLFLLAGCSPKNPDNPVKPDNPINPEPDNKQPEAGKTSFYIHYKRKDNKYNNWALWLWVEGKEGKEYLFNGKDDYGAYFLASLDELDLKENEKLGFIIKSKGSWDSKDVDGDRYIQLSDFKKDENNLYHIYLLTEDEEIYDNKDKISFEKLKDVGFILQSYKNFVYPTLSFNSDVEISGYKIYQNKKLIDSKDNTTLTRYKLKDINSEYNANVYNFDIKDEFEVEVTFKESGKTIKVNPSKNGLFDSPRFKETYLYNGELGSLYSKEQTTFKVWSPLSKEIKLRIYESGTPKSINKEIGNDEFEEVLMKQKDKGIFETTLEGDLEGKYYTYIVSNEIFTQKEVVDPYAKSCGINGLRGMIVDFEKTNPSNWNNVKVKPYLPTETVVYETHICDVTSSPTWNGDKDKAKLFTGMYQKNTKFTKNDVTVKTGYDHIVDLGINALQLIPIYDQANDEVEANRTFNWGYNPLNYNCLEGSYSSNPYDGYQRIKEFKELVKAYNEANINIIMDVVYNHVMSLDSSNFNVLMPGYYYRYNKNKPSNGSGCGNETASNREMFRKFMIDSTAFWAKEYKLGGFRFDLMGLHDLETMNQLVRNLKTINNDILVYGEPWTGGASPLDERLSAKQTNMKLYQGYGAFNDKFRDALIKGGLCDVKEKGWLSDDKESNSVDYKNIINGIKGIVGNGISDDPRKCVNYVTCHDNYTLVDRLEKAGIKDPLCRKNMATLGNSIVLTSSGVSFLLAGEEFLRTKKLNGNSYNASYEENELDYSLLIKNYSVFQNYQKLVEFKKTCKGLHSLNQDNVNKNIQFNKVVNNNIIDYTVKDGSRTYRIIHRNFAEGKITLDLTGYEVYLNTLNNKIALTSETEILPGQTFILFK